MDVKERGKQMDANGCDGGVFNEENGGGAEKHGEDVGRFEPRESTPKVAQNVDPIPFLQVVAGEWQSQDKSADGEEEIDAALAIFKSEGEGLGEGSSAGDGSALYVNVRHDDDEDCDKTEAVDFWNEPVGGDDAPQREMREPGLHCVRRIGHGHRLEVGMRVEVALDAVMVRLKFSSSHPGCEVTGTGWLMVRTLLRQLR